MKLQYILGGVALGFAAMSVSFPANAALETSLSAIVGAENMAPRAIEADGIFEIARRGRGRGGDDPRGRDDDDNSGSGRGGDDADDRNDDNGDLSGSGRRKPRIPGGSGCDDPGDILEHPECRP